MIFLKIVQKTLYTNNRKQRSIFPKPLFPRFTYLIFEKAELLLQLLAALIAYGAGSLASGLAGSLALAAAALHSAFLEIGIVESLDVLHIFTSNRITNNYIITNIFLFFNI